MKTFKECLGVLENSKEFKGWKQHNPEAFLSYGFMIIPKENCWKAGFYHPDNDNITTFTISDKITIENEEEVFKPEQMHVNRLDTAKIKIPLKKALEIAEKLQKEHYKAQTPVEKIIILQNLEKLGTIWNITYVAQTLETLNIKISAGTGEILEHKSIKLFEFKK
jgi:hypothetical protein